MNDSDTQIDWPKQVQEQCSEVAKVVHLIEDTELSSCVLACCCVTIKYLTPGAFFEIFFSCPPYIKIGWICGCLECRSDQLLGLFRRRTNKAEAIYLLRREKFIHLSLSIRRSMYLSLSIRRSNSISHEVFRRQWIESTSNTRSQCAE